MKNTIIKNKEQLLQYFVDGNTPFKDWGIGTEHEKFLYSNSNFERLSYDGKPGIKLILELIEKLGWEPINENGNLIGLSQNGASITLEPGGQFELSGKNFSSIHETFIETRKHFDELNAVSDALGFFTLPMGIDPLWSVKDISWMPKGRYQIMREYMPKVGSLGLDMMTRTATIQVNLDFESEADMVQKMRIAQAVQPIAAAIFANSPFTNGKPNGYLSYRTEIWNDTDNDRCGFLDFIFKSDFGFKDWVEYLLDVPMYFLYKDGKYTSANGMTFRQYMSEPLKNKVTMADWDLHCSTVFPDVRLKKYIEMRGADASCARFIAALSAFWVGLLYDEQSKNEALDIIANWDINNIKELRKQVPTKALKASAGDLHAGEIAKKMLQLSEDGLKRRAMTCNIADESIYLQAIKPIVESGITQAERVLDLYHHRFDGDMYKLLRYWQQEKLQSCAGMI